MTTPDEVRSIVEEALKAAAEKAPPPKPDKSYVTVTQAILSVVISTLMVIGWVVSYMNGVQAQYANHEQRIAKTEYQAQISIADRSDLHAQVTQMSGSIGDIKQTLATMNEKLDQIRARQGK